MVNSLNHLRERDISLQSTCPDTTCFSEVHSGQFGAQLVSLQCKPCMHFPFKSEFISSHSREWWILLEIELHQAFERMCSYVFSSIFLPRGYSLRLIVSGVYFRNHFSYWMSAFMKTIFSMRWKSRGPSDMSVLQKPTPVSAHFYAHVRATVRRCVRFFEMENYCDSVARASGSCCGFLYVFWMRERDGHL